MRVVTPERGETIETRVVERRLLIQAFDAVSHCSCVADSSACVAPIEGGGEVVAGGEAGGGGGGGDGEAIE